MERIKAQVPVGRLGRPDKIARVVHFFVSDRSSCITGQVWDVNGGIDMRSGDARTRDGRRGTRTSAPT